MTVAGSRGSPTGSVATFAMNRPVNSSATGRSTKIRRAHMQTSPWCTNAPYAAASTA